jgi:hypothetical protein
VSCGCVRRAPIQVGQRFGLWTVLRFGKMRRVGKWQKRKAMWLCRCDCGTKKLVCTGSLNDGSSHAVRRRSGCVVSVAPFSAASISSMLDARRPSETRSAVKALSVYADRKKAPTELGL